MLELKNSGLPLFIDETNHVMAISALLQYDGFGRKKTKDMLGLLADETDLMPEEAFYDVYRGIAFPEDQEALKKKDFRYDITIIMPGLVNGECKKTTQCHYDFFHTFKKGLDIYINIKLKKMFVFVTFMLYFI